MTRSPKKRVSSMAKSEPTALPTTLSARPRQKPNTKPPSIPVNWPGMGATTTCRNCTAKNTQAATAPKASNQALSACLRVSKSSRASSATKSTKALGR